MMFSRRALLAGGLASAAIIRFPGITDIAHAQNAAGIPSVTFKVDDVKPGTQKFPLSPVKTAIEGILGAKTPLESWSHDTAGLIGSPNTHPFLMAVTTAYHQHLPITLSPDIIWLQILQGLAQHVNANDEKLRHQFVAHEGKKLIAIRRDHFVKGNPKNDWEGVFTEFSAKMAPYMKAETHKIITNRYSTTGPVESAAMNVALMDAMQNYFTFVSMTACGFPYVTLEGSQDDWKALRNRASQLSQFDLEWWTKHLLPVLDQFVETSAGRPNKDFWCNFYKLRSQGSGQAYIHGHVIVFFPYFGKHSPGKDDLVENYEIYIRGRNRGRKSEEQIQAEIKKFAGGLKEDEGLLAGSLRRNPFMGRTDMTRMEGMTTADISAKLNKAPMIWDYFGKPYQMELLSGFIGATQDPKTLSIRPKIGWAIRERPV